MITVDRTAHSRCAHHPSCLACCDAAPTGVRDDYRVRGHAFGRGRSGQEGNLFASIALALRCVSLRPRKATTMRSLSRARTHTHTHAHTFTRSRTHTHQNARTRTLLKVMALMESMSALGSPPKELVEKLGLQMAPDGSVLPPGGPGACAVM
jgi:hypothetical protein